MAANDAKIKVIGCGGGGGCAVNRMVNPAEGVEFWSLNTDAQALQAGGRPFADRQEPTRGLGAGGNAELGETAAKGRATPSRKPCRAPIWFSSPPAWAGDGLSAPVVAKPRRRLAT